MVLSDLAKSGLESAWCMDWWIRFPIQRQKHYHYEKKTRVYHSKKHVIFHPIIAAILNVILNILQAEKQQ